MRDKNSKVEFFILWSKSTNSVIVNKQTLYPKHVSTQVSPFQLNVRLVAAVCLFEASQFSWEGQIGLVFIWYCF